MTDELLDKFKGSMLASALGDALGASNLRVGKTLRYTDDTAMMIALAEEIIEDNGIVDPSHLLRKFIEAYEREPWRGYGPGRRDFYQNLLAIKLRLIIFSKYDLKSASP